MDVCCAWNMSIIINERSSQVCLLSFTWEPMKSSDVKQKNKHKKCSCTMSPYTFIDNGWFSLWCILQILLEILLYYALPNIKVKTNVLCKNQVGCTRVTRGHETWASTGKNPWNRLFRDLSDFFHYSYPWNRYEIHINQNGQRTKRNLGIFIPSLY